MSTPYIRVVTRLPGGRQDEEDFLELEEFLDLVRSCSPSIEALRQALINGTANVHEMIYRWNPADVPIGHIGRYLASLPGPDTRYHPDRCQAITYYPQKDPLTTSANEFGITFRRTDLITPVTTRRKLEPLLWDRLLGYSTRFPVKHVEFDLASITDRFQVTIPVVEIVQLLELLHASSYRSSGELYDALTIIKPETMDWFYLCGR
ncbi:MAG: hypothetical protein KIT79_02130 [Deltaproteobacteria bacterium]|nr:hypothetical protein [Deltaproteobacteria bacterium]